MTALSVAPHRVFALCSAAAVTCLVSCQADELATLQPLIEVCVPPDTGLTCTTPPAPALAFPVVPARGRPHTISVVVRNVGAADLVIKRGDTRISAGGEAFSLGDLVDRVGPGGTASLAVQFLPLDPVRPYAGTLVVASNDAQRPEITVALSGTSGELAHPGVVVCLPPDTTGDCVEPEELLLDLGTVRPGQTRTSPIVVRSTGNTPVTVEARQPRGPFEVAPAPGATTELPPGERVTLTIGFAHDEALSDLQTGEVEIFTSDPERSVITVPLQAFVLTAGKPRCVAFEKTSTRPRARVEPPVQVELIGRDSQDPENGNLTYAWTILEKPEGYAHDLTDCGRANPADRCLLTDVIGEYTVQLTVTDTQDFTDTCDVRIIAAPKQDIYVQLTRDPRDSDLDLHLVRRGGAIWDVGDDCHFVNCRRSSDPSEPPDIDWGRSCQDCAPADEDCQDACRADNPVLEIDTVGGSEPEVIWLEDPEDVVYDVYVQMYSRRAVATALSILVSMRVSPEDAEEEEFRLVRIRSDHPDRGPDELGCVDQGLDTFCDVWHAGTINWAARTVEKRCALDMACQPLGPAPASGGGN
jgi:hypothetical protein